MARPRSDPAAGTGRTPRPGLPAISRRLVVTMAIATGVAVANNYYAQPLLAAIRQTFHAGTGETGLVVTFAQVGYALGLVFLLPLGDLFERRRLVVAATLVCALGLVGYALAPGLGLLFGAAALVGGTSVVAQILVAFAASLAGDAERGRVVGTVMSGLLLGILLARTAAGFIAQASSWRVVYVAAALATALLGAILRRELPAYREDSQLSYPQVLRSVLSLFMAEPTLRRRSLYGLLSFGAFSVLWTSLAFLLSAPPYRYSTGTIGLFGLVGAAGAAMASIAGRLADRGHQATVTTFTALGVLVAFVALWLAPHVLAVLIGGIVLLDLGCQGLHISNQSEIYRLAPQARSRVNSAYMTCYFIGGTLGSLGSAYAYGAGGWSYVCALGAGFGGLAWLVSLTERRYVRRRNERDVAEELRGPPEPLSSERSRALPS
ncbi:MAG TPA: MFS transporter [Acidimicrobiales bacterium]|nr:MFS transporter [Acidimicrobiales bacterium]